MSDATAMKNEMLDIAVRAHEAGLCVLPPKQDGSKRPLKAWESYANESSTIDEVRKWYGNGDRTGLGIVLGFPSGNLECFEFDDLDAYRNFLDAAELAGLDELVARIEAGYLEESPNGIHWLYRCSEIEGNKKLAWREKDARERTSEHDKWKVLIETRGQGGYAIIAPSHGGVHPSGRSYRLLAGGFDSIATITPEERKSLWNLAYSLSEKQDQPFTKKVAAEPVDRAVSSVLANSQAHTSPAPLPRVESERPGDWFNRTKDWTAILEGAGWTHVFDRGVESYWRRPGKDRDHSATVNYQGSDTMKVFSSSTPFDPEKSYTKFAAYTVLHHNGDYKAAARAAQREMPKESRLLGVVDPDRHDLGAPSEHEPSVGDAEGSTGLAPQPGSTWKALDLSAILNGEIDPIMPTILSREDGIKLVYPGRIHEFKGQPEAGKGWFALLACRQELRAGNTVAYIDFEDYAEGIVERLIGMGVSRDRIEKQFKYYHPEESFGEEARAALFDEVVSHKPSLCVIDSVAEVMATNALNPLDNADAATFIAMMPRPLANLGMAVVLIDHVTKSAENNRYSVGAQHKLAAVSGSSFIVEAEHPFGVGMKGSSRISVAKDRVGRVRKNAEGGKLMGRLVVHSNDDGTLIDVVLEKPLSMSIEGMQATSELIGDVAKYIESQEQRAPSTNEIRQAIEGRNEVIDLALEQLVSRGFLFREARKGRGGGFCYASIRPYTG
jgi:KaiC/GvpD/RAD55 family RecA-like ATPase